MLRLNLPEFDVKFKTDDCQKFVFDIIRKKYLVLTPEEWVRQHFLNYLINHCQYPISLIKCEGGLKYNKRLKRTDILIFNREMKPFLLVECKAPEVKIDQKVFSQAAVYNKIIGAEFVILTNGLKHFTFQLDAQVNNYKPFDGIPEFVR